MSLEYTEVSYFVEVPVLAKDGWRLHTAVFVDAGPGDRGWSYILERDRSRLGWTAPSAIGPSPAEMQGMAISLRDVLGDPDCDDKMLIAAVNEVAAALDRWSGEVAS